MKKLATLTISLAAVLAVTGAYANTPPTGIASGEWVNKYFVDFANDWPTMTSDTNATELVTSVVGNSTTGKVDRKKVTIGNNLTVNNGVLSATDTTYTAGNNVQIDANNVISATDTTYTAGDALELNGTEFNVLPDGTTIKINGQNQLYVDTTLTDTDTTYDADEVTIHLDTATNTFKGMYTGAGSVSVNNTTGVITGTDTTYTAGDNTVVVDATNHTITGNYQPGTNVQIVGNTISATDTTYTAGNNTVIVDATNNTISGNYQAGTNISISGNTISASYVNDNTELVCDAGYVRTKANRCDRILIAADTQVDTAANITTTETTNGALSLALAAATGTVAPTNVGATSTPAGNW